jgi:hypothetical protein
MKFLALFFILSGCTQKYIDYDVIRKTDFLSRPESAPIAPPPMIKGRSEIQKQCFHQWLFASNAETEKNNFKPQLIQTLCPGQEYLLETTITDTWWTVLFYSQACVHVKTVCPKK